MVNIQEMSGRLVIRFINNKKLNIAAHPILQNLMVCFFPVESANRVLICIIMINMLCTNELSLWNENWC